MAWQGPAVYIVRSGVYESARPRARARPSRRPHGPRRFGS
jgi:hypothetical protein